MQDTELGNDFDASIAANVPLCVAGRQKVLMCQAIWGLSNGHAGHSSLKEFRFNSTTI